MALGTWFARTPRRRDLVWLATLLPLGVLAQAVLGGVTVRHELAPGYVMAHFGLSMLILIAAVALAWLALLPAVAAAGHWRAPSSARSSRRAWRPRSRDSRE